MNVLLALLRANVEISISVLRIRNCHASDFGWRSVPAKHKRRLSLRERGVNGEIITQETPAPAALQGER
jgi:hypothetical protein